MRSSCTCRTLVQHWESCSTGTWQRRQQHERRGFTHSQWFSQKHSIDLVPWRLADSRSPSFPQYYPWLVTNSLGASETMTSPGQAVIFQSVGEGDLPFTSPLAVNSSTPLHPSLCFPLERGDKEREGGRKAWDRGQIQRQKHILLLSLKVKQCPQCSCNSCSLWVNGDIYLYSNQPRMCTPEQMLICERDDEYSS